MSSQDDQQQDAGTGKPGRRRGYGLQALARSLPKATAKVMSRRGLGQSGLFADWSSIVGHELAKHTLPLRLSFPKRSERSQGTLTLRVAAGQALVLQHLEPVLIERINSYLGYGAIARLAYLQGPLPQPPDKPLAEPVLEPDEQAALAARSAQVPDPDLAQALERLGRAVLQKARKNRQD